MTYALFVKINGKWLFQGTNDGLPHEYPIDSFKANVKEDAELTQNMRVKTEGYKIVNLDTDWVDTWLATQVTARSEQTVVAPMPAKSELPGVSDGTSLFHSLRVGNKYGITYKLPTLRNPRTCVATLLDVVEDTMFWDVRPLAGTFTLQPEHLISVNEVDQATSHMIG